MDIYGDYDALVWITIWITHMFTILQYYGLFCEILWISMNMYEFSWIILWLRRNHQLT